MKNQNLFLTGILTIAISCPAMADIAANANSAKCDNGTLDTYQGESTLQAQWDANTINLKWYTDSSANNGQEITPANNAAISCEYDSSITLPTNPISKPGYEFAGWRVRTAAVTPSQPQQTTFDLSTLDASIPGIRSYARDVYYCSAIGTSTVNNIGTEVCTAESTALSDLMVHQWKAEFEYGTVKGEARCSLVGSGYSFAQTGNPTEDFGIEEERYCWCKATGFDAEKDGTYRNVSSSLWVFGDNLGENCDILCGNLCDNAVQKYPVFRATLFGISQ